MPKKSDSSAPKWPHGDVVKMTAHRNGQWCKKIRGRLHYFGPISDPDGAKERYLEVARELHAGLPVSTSPEATTTIADCFNEYLAHRRDDVTESRDRTDNDDALGPAMFRRYVRAGEITAEVLGRDRRPEALKPRDFAELKRTLKERYSVGTMSAYINAIRTVFHWAYNTELIDTPVRFGDEFYVKGLKKATRKARRERGKKWLDPETINALLPHASKQIRAMMLLGLNGGFYAIDCSDLRKEAIDFEHSAIRMARHKTEVDRAVPLWPETAEALKEAIEVRPTPKDEAHEDRVFITRRGQLWVKAEAGNYTADGKLRSVSHNDYVSQEFRKLFDDAGMERPKGCGFGWLRHIFYTVARRTGDYDAVNAIMGHAGEGMVEHYLEDVDLSELRRVTDYVRRWLYEPAEKAVVGRVG